MFSCFRSRTSHRLPIYSCGNVHFMFRSFVFIGSLPRYFIGSLFDFMRAAIIALGVMISFSGPIVCGQDFDICSAVVRAPLAGLTIPASNFPGRVVILIMNDFNDDPKWTEFAVRTTGEFVNAAPPGAIVPMLATNNTKINSSAWNQRNPNQPMSFVLQKNLSVPGLIYAGGPRFILIDADGKVISDMIIDGRDLAGNSRYQSKGILMKGDDVRRIAEAGPGSPVKPFNYVECKAEANQLIQCALTAEPFTPILKALREKAGEKGTGKNSAKSADLSKDKSKDKNAAKALAHAEAVQLLAGVQEHLARILAIIERNAAENPLLAMRVLQRTQLQTAGDDFAKPFEDLAKTLKSNKSFQDEFKGAEALNVVRTAAADIYWGSGDQDAVRPKDKIVAIKQGIEVVITKFPATRAGKSALTLKKEWDKWVSKAINPLPW
jgi:hypothetical protein